jgi:hypothetical protein
MASQNNEVNVGSGERPILVPRNQVVGGDSSFWQGVATGFVLVGPPNGIDLDEALRIGKGKDDTQNIRSR